MLTYKGYVGSIEIDIELGLLCGRVLNIRDVVTFEGTTVAEAHQEFQISIDELGSEASGWGRQRPRCRSWLVRR